jgi:tripartite-type tricarboxylate transporter receptor subunit TctC
MRRGPLMRKFAITAIAAVSLAIASQAGFAQEYPSHAVRVVIPFAAGAGTDLTGRIVSQELSKRLGQQFYVENKPGAAAQLGTDLVAKSQPDGYTLLWTVTDGLSVLPAVKTVPYAIPDDFAFIGSIAQQPSAVTINTKWPFKTIAELVAYAKANPGKLNFGSAGVGSAPQLGIALMSVAADIKMVHVPFAGLGPATNALIAGTVDVGLVTPAQVKPHVDAGALRALAVTSSKRSRLLPDVPTLQETGLNVTAVVAYGLTAPAHTPAPIVSRLRSTFDAVTKDKAVTDHFRELGFELEPLIGDAYRDFIVKDLAQWRSVAKAAGIKIEN